MSTLIVTDLVKKRLINLKNSHRNRSDDNLGVVIKVLKESKVLERLRLDYSNLTLADGKFTDALANNRTMEALALSHNNIGVDGAKNIANALKVNNTIRGLALRDNEIGDKGAKHLADALKENESLEIIGLSRNNIGDEGAKSIAESLYINQRLHTIYLSGNNIGDDGATKLLEALKWNYGIRNLDMIMSNPVSEHIKTEIKGLLGNPRRKVLTTQMMHLHEVIASKDETIAAKNNLIAAKDQELNNKVEVIKGKDEEIEKTKKEIETLKKAMAKKDKQISSLKAAIRAPMEQLMNIIEAVDLIGEESEPSNKRTRIDGGTVRSNLAVMSDHTTQAIQGVKQERDTAQAAVEMMRLVGRD